MNAGTWTALAVGIGVVMLVAYRDYGGRLVRGPFATAMLAELFRT